jgi:thiol-disulfide isomerase/thioredoxin
MVARTSGNALIKNFQISIIKNLIYLVAALLLFVAPIFVHFNPLSGLAPQIEVMTLGGEKIQQPKLIYFWASWCGTCETMQVPISNILKNYKGITIAVTSGDDFRVKNYLTKQQLDWATVNDEEGVIAKQYFVKTVPTIFILNSKGEIAFVTLGYISELGLRLRLWLAS